MGDSKTVCWLGDAPCDFAVQTALTEAGWLVQERSGALSNSPPPDSCGVGLISINFEDPGWLDSVTRYVRRWDQLEYIAILSPNVLKQPQVREFVSLHCVDYQTLPVDSDRLVFAVGHARGMAILAADARHRNPQAVDMPGLAGDSPASRKMRTEQTRVARVDAPLLISGEHGSGKVFFARGVHALSSRSQGPFVVFGASSLDIGLLQAELLGRGEQLAQRGPGSQTGPLQTAHGGTIVLDEVCGFDRRVQELLARFVDDGAIHRPNGTAPSPVRSRVIAVTSTDPETAVREGRLTEDLYSRLDVLRVTIPPLRDRREDLPILADWFLDQFASERATQPRGFAPAALHAMHAYSWPGNVRELMNRVRRAIAMTDGEFVTAEDLGLVEVDPSVTHAHLGDARSVAEKQILMDALRHADGNASRAATLLGVSRATLYRLIGKHGLTAEETGVHRGLSHRSQVDRHAENATKTPPAC